MGLQLANSGRGSRVTAEAFRACPAETASAQIVMHRLMTENFAPDYKAMSKLRKLCSPQQHDLQAVASCLEEACSNNIASGPAKCDGCLLAGLAAAALQGNDELVRDLLDHRHAVRGKLDRIHRFANSAPSPSYFLAHRICCSTQ